MNEDGDDEVKNFRSVKPEETDDTLDKETHDIAADEKSEIAFEAEMETTEGASRPTVHHPLPNFHAMFSPALNMSNMYQLLTQSALSPSFQAPPFMPSLHSPSFLPFAANPAFFAAAMMQACSPGGTMQRMPPHFNGGMGMHNHLAPKLDMGSPVTSISNGMNGINLGQYPHQTPKRDKMVREKRDKNHIKKPCNAFMWFMKENRKNLIEEKGNHKQSAELNRELGVLWHKLSKEEQQKYYDMAKNERENHMKKYPNWSARDNYAIHKKKRRKREKSMDNNEQKKCRARFGILNQEAWCKHCRRKKRCLNVRDAASPMVSSTTHPRTPSRPTDSPSSSALGSGMSVGRDSATSSDESESEANTPSSSSHHVDEKPPQMPPTSYQMPNLNGAANSAALGQMSLHHMMAPYAQMGLSGFPSAFHHVLKTDK